VAFDPVATHSGVAELARAEGVVVEAANDAAAACAGADVAIVATEWSAFGSLDWDAIAPTMRRAIVLDARSTVEPVAASRAGMVIAGLIASPASPRPSARPVEPAVRSVPASRVAAVRSIPAREAEQQPASLV